MLALPPASRRFAHRGQAHPPTRAERGLVEEGVAEECPGFAVSFRGASIGLSFAHFLPAGLAHGGGRSRSATTRRCSRWRATCWSARATRGAPAIRLRWAFARVARAPARRAPRRRGGAMASRGLAPAAL